MSKEDKGKAVQKKGNEKDDKNKDKNKEKGEKKGETAMEVEATPPPPPKKVERTPLEELRFSLLSLEKAVVNKDNRLIGRATKMVSLRRKLTADNLRTVIKEFYPAKHPEADKLLNILAPVKDPEVKVETPAPAPDTTSTPATTTPATTTPATTSTPATSTPTPATTTPTPAPAPTPVVRTTILPEIEVFLSLLVVVLLFDRGHKNEAATFVQELEEKLDTYNRRTLDLLSSKVYTFYSLIFEQLDRLADIRNHLLTAHRTACLHHDEPSQAVLTNAILRNFLHFNLYAQADKFRLNTKQPESRSSNQQARYHFYIGKICSIQLHYSDAYTNLQQAIRKAPQKGAIGFRQQAHKLLVIVQLLMGEIPERSIFRQADLKKSLRPYFQLTQAVRVGDLVAFKDVMARFKNVFVKDKTYSMIVRLRQNVIKTGLRKINLSYSRISFRDICTKLHLESEDDVEFIVAKAVHDGVIDATIDREHRYVYSKENPDVYSTQEPQAAFDKRIEFCMDIHNGAVKALRFPPNMHKFVPPGSNDPEEFEE